MKFLRWPSHGAERQDVRDLLGMRTRTAYFIVLLFSAACLISAVATAPPGANFIPLAMAVLINVTSSLVLLTAPGDPLPLRYSYPLTLSGPAALWLVFAVIPIPTTNPLQTWPLGASVAIYTFMCVRGRTLLAWVGLASLIGSSVLWAVVRGQGAAYGLSFSLINAAPLLMSTFFAFTIRPLARSIFELRRQSTMRIAAEAAASAVLEERDAQLERLDELARPLLERTAAGPDLEPDEELACILLEADLRDSLRARGLLDSRLQESVRAARIRGVTVVLLDDRSDAALASEIRTVMITSAVEHIDRIESGTATVRLLPAGRAVLATILVDAEQTYRVEYAPDGSSTTPDEAALR